MKAARGKELAREASKRRGRLVREAELRAEEMAERAPKAGAAGSKRLSGDKRGVEKVDKRAAKAGAGKLGAAKAEPRIERADSRTSKAGESALRAARLRAGDLHGAKLREDERREENMGKRGGDSPGADFREGASSKKALSKEPLNKGELGKENWGKRDRELRRVIEQSGLLAAGDRVGVAVSGGADSVGLLLLLVELKEKMGLTLEVLHLNHQLRGGAAEEDEKFVARLAEKCGLAFHCERADVAALAARSKANVEDTARRARYAFFGRCAEAQRLDKIAVAHTADDQAETVLGHLLRGSGLAGLGGIHPRAGKVVRPLLRAGRGELRAYLEARRQTWREDASNRDVSKTRARIREKLIPLLKKDFQGRVVEHLAALAGHAREDNALLEAVAGKYLEGKLEDVESGASIRVADLVSEDGDVAGDAAGGDETGTREQDASNGLSNRLVRLIVGKVKEGKVKEGKIKECKAEEREVQERDGKAQNAERRFGELTALHVAQVLNLARHGRSGNSLPLPGGLEVRRQRDALVFCFGSGVASGTGGGQVGIETEQADDRVGKMVGDGVGSEDRADGRSDGRSDERNGDAKKGAANYEYKIDSLSAARTVSVSELGCAFRFSVIDCSGKRGETSELGEVLSRNTLSFPVILRNWRYGDRFHARGHIKPQKLKRLLNEKGIDRWRRAGWPVLVSGGERLVWVRELGCAPEFAASDETQAGIVISEEKLT